MLVLAIHAYPGGNDTLARHWPYFLKQEADRIWCIGTRDGLCRYPEGADWIEVGRNSYIDGPVLPRRMVDTIEVLLHMAWDHLMIVEYDTVIFHRIQVEKMTGLLAAHYAGGPTWGSKAKGFYHNPWVFRRIAAYDFVFQGRSAVEKGVCGERGPSSYGNPEASPDVFFAYVAEQMFCDVQSDLWSEFSRNDLKDGRLALAQQAYRDGVDVIHGIKTEEELHAIIG